MDPRKLTGILLVMALVGFTLVLYAFAVGPLVAVPPSGSSTPLKVWATTNGTLYFAGDAVNVTIHAENLGAAVANFSVTLCSAFGFRVEDLSGTPYYDSQGGTIVCASVIREISIAPGHEANVTFRWDQTTSTGLPLPRGRWYHVVPVVNLPHATVLETDAALVFLA